MNAHRDTNVGYMIYVSLLLGFLFSAAELYQHADSAVAGKVIEFSAWVASLAGLTGYFPALLVASLFGGIILMCIVCSIAPPLENYFTKKAADRSKKLLQQEGGMSVEDERKALVSRFAQKQTG